MPDAPGNAARLDVNTRKVGTRAGHALLLIAALAASACVRVERTLPDGSVERVSRAELPQYAEEVFKHRNAVSTQFLERTPAIEERDPGAAAALEDAERRMDAACEPVDALAIAYRDAEPMTFEAKLRLARALEGCDAATAAAERALAGASAAASD
jgi:hypothetical protein